MDDRQNVIAIAEMKGDMNAIRAENEAMESRIDASLARMQSEAAQRDARMQSEAAQRDKDNQRWIVGFGIAQIVLTITVLGAGFAFLGILIGLPN